MQKPNPGGPGAPAAHKLKTGDDLSEVVMLTDNAQMPTNVTVGPNGVIGRTGATGYLLTRLDGLLDTTWGKIKPILLGSPLADLPAPLGTFRQVLHMRLGVTDSMERLSHPAYYQDLLLPAVGNLIEMAPALTEDAPLAMEGIDVAKLSATSGTLAQVRKIRVPLEQIVNGLQTLETHLEQGLFQTVQVVYKRAESLFATNTRVSGYMQALQRLFDERVQKMLEGRRNNARVAADARAGAQQEGQGTGTGTVQGTGTPAGGGTAPGGGQGTGTVGIPVTQQPPAPVPAGKSKARLKRGQSQA